MANIIVNFNYFSDNKLSPEISNHDSARDNSNPLSLSLTRTLEIWIQKAEKSVVQNHNKDTGTTQLNQDTLVTYTTADWNAKCAGRDLWNHSVAPLPVAFRRPEAVNQCTEGAQLRIHASVVAKGQLPLTKMQIPIQPHRMSAVKETADIQTGEHFWSFSYGRRGDRYFNVYDASNLQHNKTRMYSIAVSAKHQQHSESEQKWGQFIYSAPLNCFFTGLCRMEELGLQLKTFQSLKHHLEAWESTLEGKKKQDSAFLFFF